MAKMFDTNRKLQWKILDREEVFHSPIFALFRSKRSYQGAGTKEVSGDFYYFRSNDWVTIIPLIYNTAENDYDVILVEQFRHGSEQIVLEFPAGVVDTGEEPQECALREMAEETGYSKENILHWEPIGVSYPNPAIMSNRTHTYGVLLAEDAVPKEPQLDALEVLQTHQMGLAELKQLIATENSPFASALMLQALFWLGNSRFFSGLARLPQQPGEPC